MIDLKAAGGEREEDKEIKGNHVVARGGIQVEWYGCIPMTRKEEDHHDYIARVGAVEIDPAGERRFKP